MIKNKIGMQVDTSNIDKELVDCKKRLQQLNVNKTMLENQIDGLAFDDRHYERKMQDLQNRLDGMYDKIADLEGYIEELEQRKRNMEMQMLSVEKVYKYLLNFDKLYDKFNDEEKKQFLASFVKEVWLYEEQQERGQILKRIKFRFPVFYNSQDTDEIGWDKNGDNEATNGYSLVEAENDIWYDIVRGYGLRRSLFRRKGYFYGTKK